MKWDVAAADIASDASARHAQILGGLLGRQPDPRRRFLPGLSPPEDLVEFFVAGRHYLLIPDTCLMERLTSNRPHNMKDFAHSLTRRSFFPGDAHGRQFFGGVDHRCAHRGHTSVH